MYHLHLARNLRSLAFMVVLGCILAGIGTIWWANSTGLPESWRVAIEGEISKQGTYVKIGGLSYHPLRGVIAKKVHLYADPLRQHEIAYLESVVLDFDNTKLARGKVEITKIELIDAELSLPINPEDPDTEILKIHQANGTFFLPGNRRLEARNTTGLISGIKVTLNARITATSPEGEGSSSNQNNSKRKELIAHIIGELKQWKFNEQSPPQLDILIEHKTNDPSQSIATLSLKATRLEKNLHQLEELSATAEISDNLFTVTSLTAKDSRGTLSGHLDYDLSNQNGRFDIQSSLEIPPLLQAWFGLPPIRDALIAGKQAIQTQGEFSIRKGKSPKISMTGNAICESVMLRGIQFDSASSSFAWSDGDLFLRDIELVRDDGRATGKALIQWPIVRLALDSTMPTSAYKPLYADKPLGKVIDNFSDNTDAHTHIILEGGFDLTDRTSWAYTGSGTIKDSSYRGVPINQAKCSFAASYHKLDFYDGSINFNYDAYPLAKSADAKKEGSVTIPRIFYERSSKSVTIENIKGNIWPAPMVRMFAPSIADSLEKYEFHQPPNLEGSGVIYISHSEDNSLDIKFDTDSTAGYELIGSHVVLTKPSATVEIRGKKVSVKNLTADIFSGPIIANIEVDESKTLKSEVQWTKISVQELADTYGLSMKGGGSLTGRIDFKMTAGQIETMGGKGLIAVEKTELFSVPMFGPLSKVISSVLGDRRAGFERAKSAFCNFHIEDGILTTNNFTTATSSLVFAGRGSVDLKNKTMDMTMRLNARGLLGLLTLPLRPFYGMFQFRGTGPLNDTQWENVMFTSPPETQKRILLNPPKATAVESPD